MISYKIIHRWKGLFRMQGRLMDFNVTEWEKFTGMISNSILQLIFKKLSFVLCHIKGEYSQWSKKAIKIILFQLHMCMRLDFLTCTWTKTTYHHRFYTEADMRMKLFSIKPDVKWIFKNVEQCHLFSIKMCYLCSPCDVFTIVFIDKYF